MVVKGSRAEEFKLQDLPILQDDYVVELDITSMKVTDAMIFL